MDFRSLGSPAGGPGRVLGGRRDIIRRNEFKNIGPDCFQAVPILFYVVRCRSCPVWTYYCIPAGKKSWLPPSSTLLRSLSLPNHVLHQIYLQHHSTLQLGLLSRKSDVPVSRCNCVLKSCLPVSRCNCVCVPVYFS